MRTHASPATFPAAAGCACVAVAKAAREHGAGPLEVGSEATRTLVLAVLDGPARVAAGGRNCAGDLEALALLARSLRVSAPKRRLERKLVADGGSVSMI